LEKDVLFTKSVALLLDFLMELNLLVGIIVTSKTFKLKVKPLIFSFQPLVGFPKLLETLDRI